MKLDTAFVILKGVGLVGGAVTGAAMGSMSQWINAGVSPGELDWALMGLGAASAGFASTVAFCSGSVASWRGARSSGNGSPSPAAAVVKPGP